MNYKVPIYTRSDELAWARVVRKAETIEDAANQIARLIKETRAEPRIPPWKQESDNASN